MTPPAFHTCFLLPISLSKNPEKHEPVFTKFDWEQEVHELGMTAEAFLLANYKIMQIKDVAEVLGCSRNVIMRKAKKLNLGSRHSHKVKGSHYSQDQETLIEYFNTGMCNKCIGKKMKRSSEGVRKKIERLIDVELITKKTKERRCRGRIENCSYPVSNLQT